MLKAVVPTLDALKEPVIERLAAIETTIAEMAEADLGSINEINDYLLSSRGKLLRPTLLLLSNMVGGEASESAVLLGSVVELLHVATLVHDDAVDHSPVRRGMPTVNSRWSHQVAIIMGDYLYSRAVVELAKLEDVEAIRIVGEAANRMTVGEMRQLAAHDALDFSLDDYYRLCECKTAALMSAACELGARFGRREYGPALREFGRELGMTFQVTDDLLDYMAASEATGKPSGLDLREHKVTLPLLAALPEFSRVQRARVEQLFARPEPDDALVARVIFDVEEVGGLAFSRECASSFANRARGHLEALPDEPSVQLLSFAVDYVLDRQG